MFLLVLNHIGRQAKVSSVPISSDGIHSPAACQSILWMGLTTAVKPSLTVQMTAILMSRQMPSLGLYMRMQLHKGQSRDIGHAPKHW